MDELDSEDSDNDLVSNEAANLLADTADESDSGEEWKTHDKMERKQIRMS